jgi:hypothetical protein
VRSIAERTDSKEELYRRLIENTANNLRVAMPGIIQSFDASTQTATVQLALREKIRDLSGNINQVEIPLLLDVPVVLPRAGTFILTMPVQKGDECLVIFADMCIDAWFSNGGVQNQLEKRRHDLSDAFAILGAWSQPNNISNYSTTSAQLRNETGTSYIEIKNDEINIVSPAVKVNGVPL